MKLEICVDSVASGVTAQDGGADRIELCSALAEGGLTPSAGLIRAVRARIQIGLYVMIRPRGGDFLYSDEEFAVMQQDIRVAAELGADGVVLGVLTAQGDVDVTRTRQLVQSAKPMQVTFHRAFDRTRDLEQALNDVIASGADRVLTSGGSPTALLGGESIARLVRNAGDKIRIMVGGSVRGENLQQVARATGARDYHAALRTAVPSPVIYQNPALHLGDPTVDEFMRYVVRLEDVRSLRLAIDGIDSVDLLTTLH